jgi:hypothetical protein
MAQKQHKALDQSHLAGITQADTYKVKGGASSQFLSWVQRQRSDQEGHHRYQRNGQYHPQNHQTQVVLPIGAYQATPRQQSAQRGPRLEGEKEKRSIIGDWSDVERIIPDEIASRTEIRAGNCMPRQGDELLKRLNRFARRFTALGQNGETRVNAACM